MRVAIGRSWTRKRSAIARQPLERVGVLEGDRLVGDVAARQHERHAGVGGQQLVQRRVGQHQAELGRARRDRRRRPARRAGAGQHDRTLARGQQRRLRVAELDERRAPLRRRDEQRERPVLAVLARAQRGDGGLVVGAAREVVAAEALDREDLPSSRSSARRARTASRPLATSVPSRSSSRACGPHAGQALGWAWKRRSSGSSYSAWHASHMTKPAIVVAGRS